MTYKNGLTPVSLGTNLTYRPWGLTANLTGAFAAPIVAKMSGLSDFKILKLQVSKSFGTYPR